MGPGARTKWNQLKWYCRCDCGKSCNVFAHNLTHGVTKSCGCIRSEKARARIKHGFSRAGSVSKEYKSWLDAKARCYNPNNVAYKNYGGRGIKISKEWKNNFPRFIKDMGKKPIGFTIERKNNELGYSKSNCVWASRKSQSLNNRGNKLLTLNGKTHTVVEWAAELNLNKGALYHRVFYGWSDERILTQPIRISSRTKKLTNQ